MHLDKKLLLTISIWIRLPDFLLDYWTNEEISCIALVIGTSINLDKFMEGIINIAYARVLVDVANSFDYPKHFPVLTKKIILLCRKLLMNGNPPNV